MEDDVRKALDGLTMPLSTSAKVLGLSLDAARCAAQRGEIPARKIGKQWVVMCVPLREMLGLPPQPKSPQNCAAVDSIAA